MEELLVCSVCIERYNEAKRPPVLLPRCGHSFCRPCAGMLVSGGCIICPTCRTDQRIDHVDKLPTEYTLLAIINMQESNKKETCDRHSVKLSFWCLTCRSAACGECLFEDHPTHTHNVIRSSKYITDIKLSAQDVAIKFIEVLDEREQAYYRTIFSSTRRISHALRNINVLRKDMDEARELLKGIKEEESIHAATSLSEAAKFLGLKWNIQDTNYLKEDVEAEKKKAQKAFEKATKGEGEGREEKGAEGGEKGKEVKDAKEESEGKKDQRGTKSEERRNSENGNKSEVKETPNKDESKENKQKEEIASSDKAKEKPKEELTNNKENGEIAIKEVVKTKEQLKKVEETNGKEEEKSEKQKSKPTKLKLVSKKSNTPEIHTIQEHPVNKAQQPPAKCEDVQEKTQQPAKCEDVQEKTQQPAKSEDVQEKTQQPAKCENVQENKAQQPDKCENVQENKAQQPAKCENVQDNKAQQPAKCEDTQDSRSSESLSMSLVPVSKEMSEDEEDRTGDQQDKSDSGTELNSESGLSEESKVRNDMKLKDFIQVPGFMVCAESTDGRLAAMEWGPQGLHVHCFQFMHINYDIVIKHTILNQMIASKSPTVFLELTADQVVLGRVYIRLWGHLRRAHNFLSLCLGDHGKSYINSRFLQVYNVGSSGERILGGDYETNNGRGGAGLIDDLEWNGDYALPMKAGMITAAGCGQAATNSLFLICTQSDSTRNFSCPFGLVCEGLKVVKEAVNQSQAKQIVITDCGVLIEFPRGHARAKDT